MLKSTTAILLTVALAAPVGEVLPDRGYDPGENTFTAPPSDGSDVDRIGRRKAICPPVPLCPR